MEQISSDLSKDLKYLTQLQDYIEQLNHSYARSGRCGACFSETRGGSGRNDPLRAEVSFAPTGGFATFAKSPDRLR